MYCSYFFNPKFGLLANSRRHLFFFKHGCAPLLPTRPPTLRTHGVSHLRTRAWQVVEFKRWHPPARAHTHTCTANPRILPEALLLLPRLLRIPPRPLPPPSAVDKCIVERYRQLSNQRRDRSVAIAATLASESADLPALVPCLSSSSDSSEEEEEFKYETQGMYRRHN